jgi:hypothetical protein
VAFIQLADLIVNVNCIATVKLNTYAADDNNEDIPTVNICIMLPEGSIDGQTELKPGAQKSVGKLEFEGELAMTVWNYFT